MYIEFDKDYLRELYTEGKTNDKKYRYQPQVVRKYIRVIDIMIDAPDVQGLSRYNSLNYEKLKGDKAGLSSVRVNDQYRIEFEEQVREAILSFVGEYRQVPPMYSALKVNGKKLYELAREGQVVDRKSRPVRIHEIVIESICLPEAVIRVTCSKGTYIRTLCKDIGERLGVGGCMKELLRIRAGRFRVEESLTLSRLQQLKEEGRLPEAVLPVETVFEELPMLKAEGETMDRLIHNGNPFRLRKGAANGEAFRVYDSGGMFIGVYEYSEEKNLYCPRKMFLGGN